MDETLEEIIASLLKDPVTVSVEPETIDADLIEQYAYRIDAEKKGPFLRYLINSGDWTQILIFVSSIRTADNIVTKLVKRRN